MCEQTTRPYQFLKTFLNKFFTDIKNIVAFLDISKKKKKKIFFFKWSGLVVCSHKFVFFDELSSTFLGGSFQFCFGSYREVFFHFFDLHLLREHLHGQDELHRQGQRALSSGNLDAQSGFADTIIQTTQSLSHWPSPLTACPLSCISIVCSGSQFHGSGDHLSWT